MPEEQTTMKTSIVLLLLVAYIAGQPVSNEASNSSNVDMFTFPPNTSPVYASGITKPSTTTSYGPRYDEVSHLVPNLSTTTWGKWDPSATAIPTDSDDPYGQYAWTKMWKDAKLENFTYTPIYTTAVQASSVPSESLVLPPAEDVFTFPDNLTFPEDFIFGVAGSAAQIESAVCDEGRTPTIMETMFNRTLPQDYVTNDNYWLYKQDIARIAAMGAKYYSFSIPWSRILPFVLPGTPVNKQALDHYDDLINTCIEYGMTPMITLLHFDTPHMFVGGRDAQNISTIADAGTIGIGNDTFVDAFINYGKILLTHFVDRVPIWVGFNEPNLFLVDPMAIKNVIIATSKLHSFYHGELGGKGKFGIKFANGIAGPRDVTNASDVRAAKRYQELYFESIGNALFLGKDYPDSWKQTFPDRTDFHLSAEELKQVKGGSDFFGIDPYTYMVATEPEGGIDACQKNQTNKQWPLCLNATNYLKTGWKVGYRSQSYVYITPKHLREALNFVHKTFKAPVFVTEFGFPEWREGEKELADQLFDLDRSIYYRSFMDAILNAVNLDGVDVMGALAWSFADNWEFGDYNQQFGLQVVNRTTQERFYKKSFFDLVKYVQDRVPKA